MRRDFQKNADDPSYVFYSHPHNQCAVFGSELRFCWSDYLCLVGGGRDVPLLAGSGLIMLKLLYVVAVGILPACHRGGGWGVILTPWG